MIVTQTAFRISFAGGGSDLESFYGDEPGAVLSTAIDKYMYLTVNSRFENNFRIGYSKTEIVDQIDAIEHPIIHAIRRGGGRTAISKRFCAERGYTNLCYLLSKAKV